MASAIPEHWTDLNAARKQQRLCGEDVQAIMRSCETSCGKKHVLECADCYEKALDRMFARYRDPESHEWFSQRSAFIPWLDTRFSEAKKRKLSLEDIDADIISEKEAWYRMVLRRHPEFLAVSEAGVDQEVRNVLDDPDRSREELVSMVWDAVGKPENWSSLLDSFADKVAAAGQDSAALKRVYIDEFFKDPVNGTVSEDARPYLEEYEAGPDAKLEEIVDKIIAANKDSRSLHAQRATKQSRLDELRRAKTAFEAKGLQNGNGTPAVGEKLYDLPPCSTCQNEINPKDVLSCAMCQAVSQLGEDTALTVYCSEDCYHRGQEEHVGKQHQCEAGENCVSHVDEDEVMEDEASEAVICKACFEQSTAAVFCSQRCAAENLAAHRLYKHEAKTGPTEIPDLTLPMEVFVEQILQKENPGLKFSWAA